MKKLLVFFTALIALLVVTGCGSNREFAADGEFTAYLAQVHENTPMVTTVTVTITKDKITKFYIDCLQGKAVDGGWEFNAKAKKELGYSYGMHNPGMAKTDLEGYKAYLQENDLLEWFEQAELIEAYWLANGVDSVTVTEAGKIDNVAGVTINDGDYRQIAKAAVALAKEGKMQAIQASGTDIYIATMTVDAKKNISNLMIDTLQKKSTGETFAWNTQTKQQLGYRYGMHGPGMANTDLEGYKEFLQENDLLEWFEQVKLITDYVQANGWTGDLAALNGKGGSINGTTNVDSLAAVTINTQHYYDVLADLFAKLPA